MVEFIRPVNPGASPVAQRNSYFRPQLDDREARALGELSQAYGQLRRATGSLADSYGALGQRFNQLSSAVMESQREQLRGEQRSQQLGIQQKRLDLQTQQNAFSLQAQREQLQLATLRADEAELQDILSAVEDYAVSQASNNGASFALGESVFAGLGSFPVVTDDVSQGGVTVHNADVDPETLAAIEQAGRISGANYTVTPALGRTKTQLSEIGVQTDADLHLNNPALTPWISGATDEVKQRALEVFGADVAAGDTPAFESMEDGVRYLGFWASHNGVAEGSVDQALRRWFDLSPTGPVENTAFADDESRVAAVQGYQSRLQVLAQLGLSPDTSLSDPAVKSLFVQGVVQIELGVEKLPDTPWGQLFSEGQSAYKTGKLVRNTAGTAEIFAGSREDYALQPGQTRISLDFNSTPGGTGALVVIPKGATPQQSKSAKAYVDGVQKLFQDFGYEGYTLSQGDGIQVSGDGARGLSDTIHTEPFFIEDPQAAEIFMQPEFQKRYSNLLMRTLGAIDGAVIMAPHEASAQGAVLNVNGASITEREFALKTLIPALQDIAKEGLPGNKINIAADNGVRPLALDGSDADGNIAVQALQGYGVPINGGESSDAMTVGFTDDVVSSALQNALGADYTEWFETDGAADAAVSAVQAAGSALRNEINMYRRTIEEKTGRQIDEKTLRSLPQVQRAQQRFYELFDAAQTDLLTSAIEDETSSIKLELDLAEETKIVPFFERMESSDFNRAVAQHGGSPIEFYKAVVAAESGLGIDQIQATLENGDFTKLASWTAFTQKIETSGQMAKDNYAIQAVQLDVTTALRQGGSASEVLLRQSQGSRNLYVKDLMSSLTALSALSENSSLNPAQLKTFTGELETLTELLSNTTLSDALSRTKASGGNKGTLLQEAIDVANTVKDYQEKAFYENTNQQTVTNIINSDGALPLTKVTWERGADGNYREVISSDLSGEKAARTELLTKASAAAFATGDASKLIPVFEQSDTWEMKDFGTALLQQIQADPDDADGLGRSEVGQFNMVMDAALAAGVDIASAFEGEPIAVFAASMSQRDNINPAQAAMQISQVVSGAYDTTTVKYIASEMPIAGVSPNLAGLIRLDVMLKAQDAGLAGAGAETKTQLQKLANDSVNNLFKTTLVDVAYVEGVGGASNVKARIINQNRNAFSGVSNAVKGFTELVTGPADSPEANTVRIAAAIMAEQYSGILEEANAKGDISEILGSLVCAPDSCFLAEGSDSFAARTVLANGKEGTPGVVAFSGFNLEDAGSKPVTIQTQDGASAAGWLLNTETSFDKNYTQGLQATVRLSNQKTVTFDVDPSQLQAQLGARAANQVMGNGPLNSTMVQTALIGAMRGVEGSSAIAYTITEDTLRSSYNVPDGLEIESVDFSYAYALGSDTAGFAVSRALIDEALLNGQTQRVSQ